MVNVISRIFNLQFLEEEHKSRKPCEMKPLQTIRRFFIMSLNNRNNVLLQNWSRGNRDKINGHWEFSKNDEGGINCMNGRVSSESVSDTILNDHATVNSSNIHPIWFVEPQALEHSNNSRRY